MDERLTDLEIRMAFLERTLGDLDAVVREFADEVIALRREVGDLKTQIVTGLDEPGDPSDEVPPHY